MIASGLSMAKMIPVGYLAKRVVPKPDILKAPQVVDIYSISNCMNDDFADYIGYWKHNGYWLFDSPEIIRRNMRSPLTELLCSITRLTNRNLTADLGLRSLRSLRLRHTYLRRFSRFIRGWKDSMW
jgi:hypothetical protein